MSWRLSGRLAEGSLAAGGERPHGRDPATASGALALAVLNWAGRPACRLDNRSCLRTFRMAPLLLAHQLPGGN